MEQLPDACHVRQFWQRAPTHCAIFLQSYKSAASHAIMVMNLRMGMSPPESETMNDAEMGTDVELCHP